MWQPAKCQYTYYSYGAEAVFSQLQTVTALQGIKDSMADPTEYQVQNTNILLSNHAISMSTFHQLHLYKLKEYCIHVCHVYIVKKLLSCVKSDQASLLYLYAQLQNQTKRRQQWISTHQRQTSSPSQEQSTQGQCQLLKYTTSQDHWLPSKTPHSMDKAHSVLSV